MSATRKAYCNNIYCDAASDLPAAGQWTGQIAWINSSPIAVKRWDGSSWATVTPSFGFGNGRYTPDQTPASGLDANSSDEFIGSINTGIQTWGNQGTATITAEFDTMRLHTAASATRDRKCIWYTMPSGDWVMSTRVSGGAFNWWRTNLACGLLTLETGSIATPTAIGMTMVFRDSATTQAFGCYTSTSYTAVYTIVGTLNTMPDSWIMGGGVWLQMRYVSSSKALSSWGSVDGFNFAQVGTTRTLGAAPLNIGVFVDQNTSNVANDIRFHYVRTRTDATGTSTPFPVG